MSLELGLSLEDWTQLMRFFVALEELHEGEGIGGAEEEGSMKGMRRECTEQCLGKP